MSSKQAVSKHSMSGKPPRVPQDRAFVARYGRGVGVEVSQALVGDFILTHDNGWTSKLIRFGQRLRYRGREAEYARFNHAAIIVSETGDMVEAVGAGVVRSHIRVYRKEDYVLVRIDASEDDRWQAADYANYWVGSKYGYVTILSIAWTLLTGGKFSFGMVGQFICSGLVAGALERTGAIWDRPNESVMPADLARYYDVREG